MVGFMSSGIVIIYPLFSANHFSKCSMITCKSLVKYSFVIRKMSFFESPNSAKGGSDAPEIYIYILILFIMLIDID